MNNIPIDITLDIYSKFLINSKSNTANLTWKHDT